MDIKDRFNAVNKWLEENVQIFKTPKLVVLSGFRIKRGQISGSFDISLDNLKISDKFSFGPGMDGKFELFFPMFHSPLGVPASYPAVVLTTETISAIKDLLTSTLPKIKPLGFNRETGVNRPGFGGGLL